MPKFDLDKHAVVEASAGTGKTYTLEELVLQLLEAGVQLDQILLMTFTEKATGELKGRVRVSIERALKARPEQQHVFQPALDQFDQIAIYTIHGFCQRMLQEYPVEHGQDFQPQLVDDDGLFSTCLREIQRRDWPRDYGERLQNILELAYRDKDGQRWETLVLRLAHDYRPAFGHRLLPDPGEELLTDLSDEELAARLVSRTVRQLHECVSRYKRERGLRSYDDMLIHMDEGLDPAVNPEAGRQIERLRQRFRYAVVDEFQDTDPLQWRIFKRLFVEGGRSRLIVVGDPKQAIFGFRGADLPTYQAAVREMTNRFAADPRFLDTNWRSSPELLRGLNQLFEQGGWFDGTNILYRPVSPSEKDEQPQRIGQDRTGRPALTIIDYTPAKRLSDARRRHAQVIAVEIRRLLGIGGSGPLLEIVNREGKLRPINAADIGVLVFKRAELLFLFKAFRKMRIPFSVYKQTGLWQADEVDHLEYVLGALARPDDRAAFRKSLLTDFFAASPENLIRADELPPSHHARTLLQKWRGLADRRAWSTLFRSLLEDTGLLLRAAQDEEEGERRVANYRHIIGCLEQAAYAQDLDLLAVLDLLTGRRLQAGQDANYQPIETERHKVQIMTVHACKGLEFPIVFLAGGFTAGYPTDYLRYRDADNNVVLDLVRDQNAKQLAESESDHENRRLLYVALTRAMFKLYLPLAHGTRGPGPVATILCPALERSAVSALGAPYAVSLTAQECLRSAPARQGAASPAQHPPVGAMLPVPAELFPSLDPGLHRRRIRVASFSSLHRRSRPPEKATYVERPARADDDAPGALDAPEPLRGPVFGDMVHNVLETLDFTWVGRAADPTVLLADGTPFRKHLDEEVRRGVRALQSRVRGEDLENACRTQVTELIWKALRTPLKELGGPLWQIAAADRIQEVEFHFPDDSKSAMPPEVRREEGFLTGFMDLVCRSKGRYFLVDWKTNWLDAYDPESLARAMIDSDYIRQYRLYVQALARWLAKVRGDFDFARDFGGIYYLFLRGMNGKDESMGVFFHRPNADDLKLDTVLEAGETIALA